MVRANNEILELRYDGPIPEWERPDHAERERIKLHQRLNRHRRMALTYADEARRQRERADEAGSQRLRDYHTANHHRALRNLDYERRAHSRLAAHLGSLTRPRA